MTTIQGLYELNRKLKTLEEFQQHFHDPMEESLALMQDYIAKVPRKAAGAFSAMASPAQKRAYWARVSAGQIDHNERTGYSRTGTLARGWTFEITRTGKGLRGTLGNRKAGGWGVYVQGNRQQPFHKASGWRTVDDTIEATADKVAEKFQRKVREILNK